MTTINGNFKSTYRLQLHEKFRFRDVIHLLKYFDDLGISHLYLSPILESRPKSLHGYDGVDPHQISQERGGESDFKKLLGKIEQIRKKDGALSGIVLDIVPNHLATHITNPAWRDALENGPSTESWRYFDFYEDKVLIPCLGADLEQVLEKGEIKIIFKNEYGFLFQYYENLFPISTEHYPEILLQLDQWGSLKKLPRDFISSLIKKQHYTLEEWRKGVKKISYRRFFDINELIGVRIDDEKTFLWSHKKIFELLQHPLVQGLRIDHIDGLLRPKQYLQELRKHCNQIWVEKILSEDEALPYDWPVLGTTGYEFSSMAAGIFVEATGYQKIHDVYLEKIDQRWKFFSDCVYQSKRAVLKMLFEKELNDLSERVYRQGLGEGDFKYTADEIKTALEELTVGLKVYRLYYQSDEESSGLGQNDRRWLMDAADEVRRRQSISEPVLAWLVNFLSTNPDNSEVKKNILGRWQQLTGPIMAKGFEDTALYRYCPLVSLNTIGGQPDWNYSTVMEFHSFIQERLKSHPLSLNCTTTHDTKRNADVVSRIHVLSEIPDRWLESFEQWHKLNQPQRTVEDSPSKVFEYFIYQNLVGAFPLDQKISSSFKTRMKEYFIKAARESKLETSWLDIDENYERGLLDFIDNILSPKKSSDFLRSFSELAHFTAYFGAFNSLSQLALKILSPGIPDTYQGTESWSYSLVDPDNRRPVDYKTLLKFSERAKRREKAGQLFITDSEKKNWMNGEIKYLILRILLKLRNKNPFLFETGKYIPLEIKGLRQTNVFGFARMMEGKWFLVLVPRFLSASIPVRNNLHIPVGYWEDSILQLPLMAPRRWTNCLSGRSFDIPSGHHEIKLAELFDEMPVAVLTGEVSENERKDS